MPHIRAFGAIDAPPPAYRQRRNHSEGPRAGPGGLLSSDVSGSVVRRNADVREQWPIRVHAIVACAVERPTGRIRVVVVTEAGSIAALVQPVSSGDEENGCNVYAVTVASVDVVAVSEPACFMTDGRVSVSHGRSRHKSQCQKKCPTEHDRTPHRLPSL